VAEENENMKKAVIPFYETTCLEIFFSATDSLPIKSELRKHGNDGAARRI
jgi:hypothetical protein